MEKEKILKLIKETAKENNNTPLGQRLFEKTTGITRSTWRGKFWVCWSDALNEAGFKENMPSQAVDPKDVLLTLIKIIRKLKKFPSYPEIRMECSRNKSYPGVNSFNEKLGSRNERIEAVRKFAEKNKEFSDILKFLPSLQEQVDDASNTSTKKGHVYLLKHNKEYKIGKSFDVTKRYKQIKVQMPYEGEEIHVIETDDPSGIEAYWHNRFKDKRLNGEWFKLSVEDVKIFKKRKFM